MQVARFRYLAAFGLIPNVTSPRSGGEISFRRECFQRRDLRRVGLNRELHPHLGA